MRTLVGVKGPALHPGLLISHHWAIVALPPCGEGLFYLTERYYFDLVARIDVADASHHVARDTPVLRKLVGPAKGWTMAIFKKFKVSTPRRGCITDFQSLVSEIGCDSLVFDVTNM